MAAEWDFPAYEAVVRRADRVKADLIVAERHAGRHFAPWHLHLNDWELLRSSRVPVLLVKSSGAYRHPVVLAAVDPALFEKPAKLDDVILHVGAAVTHALRGTLHVAHAHPSVLGGTMPRDAFSPEKAARMNSGFITAAKAQLDRLLRSATIPRSSDIVVMGALSRSGLKGDVHRQYGREPVRFTDLRPAHRQAPELRKPGAVRAPRRARHSFDSGMRLDALYIGVFADALQRSTPC